MNTKLIERCKKSQKKAPMWHKIMNARFKCFADLSKSEINIIPIPYVQNPTQVNKNNFKMLKSKLNTIKRLQEDWDDDLITEEFVENELNRVGYGSRSHSSNNLNKEKIKYE